MTGEPQGTSSRTPEALDPEKLLLDLGWSDGQKAGSAPARPRSARLYCSFCWTAIPDGDVECASCGRSLEEIRAAAAAARQASAWVPERLGGGTTVSKRSPREARVIALSNEKRGTLPPVRAARRGLRTAFSVASVVLLLGASAGAGAFLGQMSVGRAARARSASSNPITTAATTQSGTARIEWENPYAKMRLQLIARDGKVLAASDQGSESGRTVKPGEYRLRTSDIDGQWHPVERTVRVADGETIILSPSSESVADYYTSLGARLRNAGRLRDAMDAWRTAIEAHSELIEPRLQLAEGLITESRWEEAAGELRTALDMSPDDPRAIRLLRRLRTQSSR